MDIYAVRTKKNSILFIVIVSLRERISLAR